RRALSPAQMQSIHLLGDPTRLAVTPPELLRSRRFGPFFWTQLLNALNDNVYKNTVVMLFAFGAVGSGALSADTLVNLRPAPFIAPSVLSPATGGGGADKVAKSRLIRIVKLAEVVIMVIGAIGFHLGSQRVLLAVLFLMGTHSAVFGPVKYGILPQHLEEDEL